MTTPPRYRVYFKSHKSSTREYWVEASSQGAVHFVEASLRANHWIVLRYESGDHPS